MERTHESTFRLRLAGDGAHEPRVEAGVGGFVTVRARMRADVVRRGSMPFQRNPGNDKKIGCQFYRLAMIPMKSCYLFRS